MHVCVCVCVCVCLYVNVWARGCVITLDDFYVSEAFARWMSSVYISMCLVLQAAYIRIFYICLNTYGFIYENLYVLKKFMKHIIVSDERCKITQKLCSGNNRGR